MKEKKRTRLSESFVVGVIAMVFMIVGYQTALFVYRASVMKIVSNRDEPDTVFVYPDSGTEKKSLPAVTPSGDTSGAVVRKAAKHSRTAEAVRKAAPGRTVESFRFNPNTVTIEELCRLGFSFKQAQSIDNYRKKGGRFRRRSDFAKSYVVSDSIFLRLEPYIDIPQIDLNLADSADFDSLPGIGGWFASRMVEHRKALGGYSYKEQLMDIYRFTPEKYEALEDLVTVSAEFVTPYPLWSLPADSLKKHPYIKDYETARSIVLYRENTPQSSWHVDSLAAAGILPKDRAAKMSRCVLLGY